MGIKNLVLSNAAKNAGTLLSKPSLQRVIFNAVRLNRPEVAKLLVNEDLHFLAYCVGRRRASRAQILQDLWVCYELGEKRDGYFVEFGSTDGITNSNTWLLEKKFGWRGILAEPNPVWHAELSSNRTAAIEHRCVSSKSGEQVAFLTTNGVDPELSGIASFAAGDHFASIRRTGDPIIVETISLNDMLDDHDAPGEIDYISIDTEGNEFDILSGFDFDRRGFKLISVEQNPATEKEIAALLEKHGYIRVFPQFSQWDGWYVSKQFRSQLPCEIIAPAT
jgi:FkbM family methyltransferase